MPKVSVIVPVYNVENYIGRCIESIQKQSLTDWELLLIDDGSTDGSGNICDSFAEKDDRITVFHKPNGGVSSARNYGLEHAKGQWLAFVDSDDNLNKDYLTLDNVPEDSDVIYRSFVVYKEEKIISDRTIIKERFINGSSIFLADYVKHRENVLWNKIIKREVIGDMKFDTNVRIGEDFLFFVSILRNITSCYYSVTGCYNYYVRENTASTNLDRNSRTLLDIVLYNIQKVRYFTNDEQLKATGDALILISYLYYIDKLSSFLTSDDTLLLKRIFKDISILSLRAATVKQIMRTLPLYFKVKRKILL